ncbi:mannose-6-phosphate isomerase, class I [Nesterenkonia halotolerans]|uniref:mannose-6-phosphate isomerase n=1 Tax=Nesterenkonia halotolerans TaxID=225325 RepID=A0ABR9J9N5_9MICC|nr:mannose-6-phosphate isomerase, class I [Nesterenkonia halotolerans]MBE1515706.1 mannose-6-phosphate isomerase [Nesterenkonia halotolerans]
MFRMINPVREYAWGSTTAFSELFGWASSASPRAEIWMGAHPGDPSSLELGPEGGDMDAASAVADGADLADPAVLAESAARSVTLPEYLQRSGEASGSFPFLLKVLAAEQPLSIQSHPTRARAQAGFAAEEATGLPLDAPTRSYKDPNAKPELIVALTEFSALCGFRPYAEAAAELSGLVQALGGDAGESAPGVSAVVSRLQQHVAAQDYSRALEQLLRSARAEATAAAGELSALLADGRLGAGLSADAAQMLQHVAQDFPRDPGIFVTLLLNRLLLAPGESIYLPAGNLHAYLHGVGVEIMANSDNVLRGGLTSKHLDVDELLKVTDCEVLPVPHCPVQETGPQEVASEQADPSGPTPPRRLRYEAPFEEFQLEQYEFPGEATLDAPGHGILLCTAGEITLSAPEASETLRMLTLTPGTSAFLPETVGHRVSAGEYAQAFMATTSLASRASQQSPASSDSPASHHSPDQEHPRP